MELTDKLTGCRVNGAFAAEFEKFMSTAAEQYCDVTLAMLDIDNFQHINNTFGHNIGDDILREVGSSLAGADGSCAYRYAGDQFAVVLVNTEKEQAFLIMEKVREFISNNGECQRTGATISVGIATFPEDGSRLADIVRKSEGALYRAKTSGRNKICIAKDEKLMTKTAHYSVEQLKRLKELSERQGIVEASLMREALDDLLKKYDNRSEMRRTAIIIDDAPIMRAMLREILTSAGFAVVGEAEDGETGLELFRKTNPDFTLLGIVMPHINGIEFLKRITPKAKNNLIMVTAAATKRTLLESIMNGADAFIAKPFQGEYLAAVMNNLDKYRFTKDDYAKYERILNSLQPEAELEQSQIDELCRG